MISRYDTFIMVNIKYPCVNVRVATKERLMALAGDPSIDMFQADFIEACLDAWESLGPTAKVRIAMAARTRCREMTKAMRKPNTKKKESRA